MAEAENRNGGGASSTASTMLSGLVDLAREKGGLTIGEALLHLGKSGFGFVMLLLALPALIPIPGPFGMVFGSALAIVALQFGAGARSLWLPGFLKQRKMPVKAFEDLKRYATPIVVRIEQLVRPGRLEPLAKERLGFLFALPIFVLAVAVALPIPFGNLAPVVAICFIALGMIERDGLLVLIGLALTALALGITFFLVRGAATAFAFF
ncbi:exopolysaccharide biosynthesis protein [Neorhizobium vignae]|jgi:hypothetical protein|uniref:exopolysaccharide biosynthesis protein n=1 Tax=Neorhizobium vignae TaxID=690585 RepID=UPI000565B036|nr:exopolysaccharide biosynthesis protein [Neorhizobium vignae]